jgi:hypothetical protein
MELWNIIAHEWNEFAPLLKRDKNYWQQRFSLISKIRTPLAHNRENVIQDSDRDEAEGACKRILECVENLSL